MYRKQNKVRTLCVVLGQVPFFVRCLLQARGVGNELRPKKHSLK